MQPIQMNSRVTVVLLFNIVFLVFNLYLIIKPSLTQQTVKRSLDSDKGKEVGLGDNGADNAAEGQALIDSNDRDDQEINWQTWNIQERKHADVFFDAYKNGYHKTNAITEDYSKLRETYQIPPIETQSLVNCAKMVNNNKEELQKAKKIVQEQPKIPIAEEQYLEWTRDCPRFRRERGYIEVPLSKEEEEYPLAFSIAMYTDVEQSERLLRSIYQPQNLYCFHIDIKAPLLVHRTVQAITDCFPNVAIAYHIDKIKWGDYSVLLPAVNCMRHLVKYHRGKWNYYINLTGQELMLRSNYELVQIAKIFNGGNDIAGSKARMEHERVKYEWGHRWSKTYQQMIFYNKYIPRDPPKYNLTFYKGELHGLFTRKMVEYIVESEVGKYYLDWCWDSGHPSEHYWNVLNYNTHLKAPGGYEGPEDEADEYSYHPAMRVKNWVNLSHYDGKPCEGKVVRGICVYGIGDVPWLASRNELAANKFYLTYQYLAYDCIEELHRNRTMAREKISFDVEFYKNLPTVKYSRKDGL